jgi:hypothetical protein
MTLDRDPTGILLVGDAVVIRFVGTSLTANPTLVTQVTDTGCQNITNGYGGMTPGPRSGILSGLSRAPGATSRPPPSPRTRRPS